MGKAIDESWYTLNAASGSFVENSYLANSYQIVGKCRKVHKHLSVREPYPRFACVIIVLIGANIMSFIE